MNERIEKLAVQARAETYAHFDDETFDWDVWHTVFQHKFAELIVRECTTAFEAEVDTWKEMDPYQGSIKRQGTKAIKQHFGVTE